MSSHETISTAETLKKSMADFAEQFGVLCVKYYSPMHKGRQTPQAMNAVVKIACFQLAKFKIQNPFGVLGVIRLVKMLRKQLKRLEYDSKFVNDMTIYLVLALMRTPTGSVPPKPSIDVEEKT